MALPRLGPAWAAAIVSVLLICFAAISFTAVLGKSATFDEPLHLVGGMVHRYAHDFRINPEDPALFGWWASLPHSRDELPLNTDDRFFKRVPGEFNVQWLFTVQTLFENPAVDVRHFINVSRAMFVLVGIALGALIACWAYQIGGGWAAIVAALLFCFDPNFLAHSAVVKNDVPLSLMMCLLGFFAWRFGRNGGWHWLILGAIACGLAFNVKFSAVLFGPVFILLLAVRACLHAPWNISGQLVTTWTQRVAVVLLGTMATAVAIYLLTWGVYGFRYAATADGQPLDINAILVKSVHNGIVVGRRNGELQGLSRADATALEKDRISRGDFALPVKLDLWMRSQHLLPEGWLFGFLFTYANTLVRGTYLLGKVGDVGRWYYFPVAMIFKTPLSKLLAGIVVAPVCLVLCFLKRPASAVEPSTVEQRQMALWTVLVLAIPPMIYFLAAMGTHLNLGLRHILPVYPYLFVALGVGAAAMLRRWPKPTIVLCGVLFLGLLTETISAYPNFIPFFNVISDPFGGGSKLLGDSNLDWGQDLPAMAQWQKDNPGELLYFCYFGSADPNSYGVHYVNIRGGWQFAARTEPDPAVPGVVAISVTNLQGIYLTPELAVKIQTLMNGEKPFRVLNGTINLYHWPPEP